MSDTDQTQPPEIPADLSALSATQLEDLVSDYPEGDPLRVVLAEVLAQRRKAEASAAKKTSGGQPTPKGQAPGTPTRTSKGRKLRAGEPGDRAMAAADTFNSEPAKVAVWREALSEATDPATGEIMLTGRIVQLGINAYFAQRKIDDAAKKAAAQQPPIVATTQPAAEDDEPQMTDAGTWNAAVEGMADAIESLKVETPAGSTEGLAAPTIEDELLPVVEEQSEAPFVSVSELPGGMVMLSTPEGDSMVTDLPLSSIAGLFEDDDEVWDD